MSDTLRTPPHSDEAERSLLGALMLDNDKIDIARDRLGPEDFYRERHRNIYRAMLACDDQGQGLDVVTIGDQLAEHGQIESVGGPSFLTRLSNEVPSSTNLESYVDRVERYSHYRQAAGHLSTYLDQAYDPTDPFDEFAAEISHAVEGIIGESANDTLKRADEIAEDCVRQAEEWTEDDAEAGLTTGFSEIDKVFKLEPSRLYVFAGRPGMGKSALAQGIQGKLSMDHGLATVMFSTEMSCEQVGFRHICQRAQIDQTELRRGTLGEQGWRSLIRATAEEFKPAPLWVDDTTRPTIPGIRSKVRRMVRQYDVRCVFVDFLQRMKPPHGLRNQEQKIGALANGLKDVAKECGLPVVLLSQLNRGVEDRQNKVPKIRDLRASGQIEEAADVVAFIYREAFYDEASENDGPAELHVEKNRSGAPGIANLYFHSAETRFTDLDRRRAGFG